MRTWSVWIWEVSQREKSGVTGFLAGLLEMRWEAGWCGKGVDSVLVGPLGKRLDMYVERSLDWDRDGILSSCWVLEATCLGEILLEVQQGMKNSSQDGPRATAVFKRVRKEKAHHPQKNSDI